MLRAHLQIRVAKAMRLRRAKDVVADVNARFAPICSIQEPLVGMASELHALLLIACIAMDLNAKTEEEECLVRVCIYSILTR